MICISFSQLTDSSRRQNLQTNTGCPCVLSENSDNARISSEIPNVFFNKLQSSDLVPHSIVTGRVGIICTQKS